MEENRSMGEINKIKDYNKSVFSYRKTDIDMKFKEEINGQESFGHEFSWPPRSYACTFCKKEFRSAQALGGHMNVHRREKAKLREINPIRYLPFLYPQSQHFSSNSKFLDLNLNLDPNTNPNPNPSISTSFSSNTSSFPTMLPPLTYSSMSHPLIHRLCPPNCASFSTFRSRKSDIILDGFEVEKESTMNIKKSATGLLVESKFDDLDLELRLGCS